MFDIFTLERKLGRPVVIGMVHLRPLPGAPRFSGDMGEVLDSAHKDAGALFAGGVDALMVENFGDTPFYPGNVPAVTVAAIARCVTDIRREVDIPVGVNVLRNDVEAALGIAKACGGEFVRANVLTGAMLTDQGIIQGNAHSVMRLRRTLSPDIAIFSDILVKHATPLAKSDPAVMAEEAVDRGLADGIIVTGNRTGDRADPELVRKLKDVTDVPLIVGSGVTLDNVKDFLSTGRVDALIVGSHFKKNGRIYARVDQKRVRKFMGTLNR